MPAIHRLVLLLGAASVASAAVAGGQGQAPTADTSVEDILVTARKRTESLLDVPLSVTAISGEDIVRAGKNTLTDIQNSVPNLQYSARGDYINQINIRGVGGDPRNVGTESGVSLYIDGVYAGRTAGWNQDLANIERLEVLRGPQGTLFGKNTIGGVINIVTERPGDSFSGTLRATAGNYQALALRGNVSGPLSDRFRAGVTLSGTQRQGYVRNLVDRQLLNGVNRRGGRLQFELDAAENVLFYWTADHTINDSPFALTQLGPPFAGSGAPYGPPANTRHTVSFDQSSAQILKSTGVSQTIEWELPNEMSITSVTAWRDVAVDLDSDSDSLPIDIIHAGPFTDESEFWSQELRLASPSSGSVTYVVGFYYFNQTAEAYRALYVGGSLPNGFESFATVKTEAIAGFGNIDVRPFENFTLTGGLRYTSERKRGSLLQRNVRFNYQFDDLRRLDTDLSWVASANYRILPTLSVYATASKGFKSGGFNVEAIQALDITAESLSFAPESLLNLEAGIRGRLLDNRLSFSLSAFTAEFDDKQVSQFLGEGIPIIQIGNAASARIKGFELEGSLRPADEFAVNFSLAHLDARYTDFPNAARVGGVLVSYTGNRLENSPKWSATLGFEGRVPTDFGEFSLRLDGRYTGSTYFQPDNLPVHRQNSYVVLDGRVALEFNEGRTSVAFIGRNFTDTNYFVFSRFALGNRQLLYGEPRMYGFELIQRF
jgi:iron complex outermembrane receptor protein